MMVELKDANEVYEQVKAGNFIYYRDPEYPSNYRKVDPKVAIAAMNPFTHPDTVFYRLISEEEAIEDFYQQYEKELTRQMHTREEYPHSTDFFLEGWECCKKYYDWRFKNV